MRVGELVRVDRHTRNTVEWCYPEISLCDSFWLIAANCSFVIMAALLHVHSAGIECCMQVCVCGISLLRLPSVLTMKVGYV